MVEFFTGVLVGVLLFGTAAVLHQRRELKRTLSRRLSCGPGS